MNVWASLSSTRRIWWTDCKQKSSSVSAISDDDLFDWNQTREVLIKYKVKSLKEMNPNTVMLLKSMGKLPQKDVVMPESEDLE